LKRIYFNKNFDLINLQFANMSLYQYILSFVLFSVFLNTNAANLKSVSGKIYIGGAIAANLLSESAYKTLVSQQYNCLTPENEMKWDSTERSKGQFSYSGGDTLVAFAEQNGMKVRGHTLVWHAQLPGFVSGLSKTDLETEMKNHITNEVTHYKGKIYAWDVVNEIFNEDGSLRDSIWHKNFGTSFVAEAFKTAHAADPNAKLYINDYRIEGKNKKSDGVYALVKELQSQGVPIHGVGFQAHFAVGELPHDLASNLERFSALGLDVAITELDIAMQLPSTAQKLAQQATDYATVFKACRSVSRCVGVTIWGITDKHSWLTGDALPWDANYAAKPAVAAIEAALKGT
jgi:endo-1,4-beta-xylanase